MRVLDGPLSAKKHLHSRPTTTRGAAVKKKETKLPGDVDFMKGGSSKNVILMENFSGTPCVCVHLKNALEYCQNIYISLAFKYTV